jgi:dipeptidase
MTLQEVKTEILKLGKIIFVSDDKYPDFGSSSQNGNPHLEVDKYGNFYFIVAERNEEFERRITKDFQEFLFWIFENITFSMACDYELNNRIENQDYRILIFQKQDELLEKLDNSWAKITRKKHEKLLLPNEETKRNRKAYCNKLESQGIDILTAWTKACEKYPTIKKNIC